MKEKEIIPMMQEFNQDDKAVYISSYMFSELLRLIEVGASKKQRRPLSYLRSLIFNQGFYKTYWK